MCTSVWPTLHNKYTNMGLHTGTLWLLDWYPTYFLDFGSLSSYSYIFTAKLA